MKEILERLEQKMDAGFAKADLRFDTVDGQLQKQGVLLESVSSDVKIEVLERATRYLATRKPKSRG